MESALEVFDVWPLTFSLCLCIKTVFITPHIFLMQSETEYSFFKVVGSYGKQDTWASNWTFHFVLFFFSLKCAKIRIDHRQEGLVGDSKIFFVVARQKIFRFVSNFPSFSFLESFWDGSWCMFFVCDCATCLGGHWTLKMPEKWVTYSQRMITLMERKWQKPTHGERSTVLRSAKITV